MPYERTKKWTDEKILVRGGVPDFANSKAFKALPAEAQQAILASMSNTTIALVESVDGSASFLKLVAGRVTVAMSPDKFRAVLTHADLVKQALEKLN